MTRSLQCFDVWVRMASLCLSWAARQQACFAFGLTASSVPAAGTDNCHLLTLVVCRAAGGDVLGSSR